MSQKAPLPTNPSAQAPQSKTPGPPPPPATPSRPIPVPVSAAIRTSAAKPNEDEDSVWQRWNMDMLPSWLSSMVFHMTVFILLAMIAAGGSGNGGPGNTIYADLQMGGDSTDGDSDALLAGDDLLKGLQQATMTDPTATLPTESIPLVDPAAMLAVAPPMELSAAAMPNLGAGLGTGGSGSGSGGANGDDHGRGGSGPAGLGLTTTGIFGLVSEGSTFVYVFDRSGSMNSALSYTSAEGATRFSVTPLVAAKAELTKSLKDLGKRQQFHVLFYNSQVTPFETGRAALKPITATSENLKRVVNFVQAIEATGKTYHFEPMEMALKMRPDVIFLLTDGEKQDDPTEAELAELNTLNKGKRTKINVIQIGFEQVPDGTLTRLAKENRGTYRFLNIADLGAAMTKNVN